MLISEPILKWGKATFGEMSAKECAACNKNHLRTSKACANITSP
jgi:hypothetical protein